MQAWIRWEGELSHALLWASGEYNPLAFLFCFVFFSPEKASNPNYCNRKKYKEDGQPLLSETESPGSF